MTCCAAFGDWDGAVLRPLLALSELTACFTLAYMSRAADALDGLGLLDKVYLRFNAFLDAWEVALPRVPSPSPFELAHLGPSSRVVSEVGVTQPTAGGAACRTSCTTGSHLEMGIA